MASSFGLGLGLVSGLRLVLELGSGLVLVLGLGLVIELGPGLGLSSAKHSSPTASKAASLASCSECVRA